MQGSWVQSGRSGRYSLGPFAAQLGLAALSRNDFVNRAADGLEELCLQSGMTALLTGLGQSGRDGGALAACTEPCRHLIRTWQHAAPAEFGKRAHFPSPFCRVG